MQLRPIRQIACLSSHLTVLQAARKHRPLNTLEPPNRSTLTVREIDMAVCGCNHYTRPVRRDGHILQHDLNIA